MAEEENICKGCGAVERDFQFWMPLSVVEKAGTKQMRVGGIASDQQSPDLQGETVFVDGLETDYLLERGVFNWNHGKEPGDILGEIDIVNKDGGKLYVEGFMYPTVKQAVDTYNLMRSMKDVGSKRKLGLSIEGKIKERSGKEVRKAWLKAVAMTYNPINQGSWVDVMKSLEGHTFNKCDGDCGHCKFVEKAQEKIIDAREEVLDTDPAPAFSTMPICLVCGEQDNKCICPKVAELPAVEIDPRGGESNASSTEADSRGEVFVLEAAQSKPDLEKQLSTMSSGMSAGFEREEEKKKESKTATPDVALKTEGGVDKAMSAGYDIPGATGGVSGSALREEDLKKKPVVTTYDERHLGLKKFSKKDIKDTVKAYGYSDEIAERITDLIFKAKTIQVKPHMASGHPVKGHPRHLTKERKPSGKLTPSSDLKVGDMVEVWTETGNDKRVSGTVGKKEGSWIHIHTADGKIVPVSGSVNRFYVTFTPFASAYGGVKPHLREGHAVKGHPRKLPDWMLDVKRQREVEAHVKNIRERAEALKAPYQEADMEHEYHRIRTMTDRALKTRAYKITDPNKLLNFYRVATEAGKVDVVAEIIQAGKGLGLSEGDFRRGESGRRANLFSEAVSKPRVVDKPEVVKIEKPKGFSRPRAAEISNRIADRVSEKIEADKKWMQKSRYERNEIEANIVKHEFAEVFKEANKETLHKIGELLEDNNWHAPAHLFFVAAGDYENNKEGLKDAEESLFGDKNFKGRSIDLEADAKKEPYEVSAKQRKRGEREERYLKEIQGKKANSSNWELVPGTNMVTQKESNWEKVPSVTSGGKKNFFTRNTPKGRVWVVWDRGDQKWAVQIEPTTSTMGRTGQSNILGKFDSPEEGKKFVGEWLEDKGRNVEAKQKEEPYVAWRRKKEEITAEKALRFALSEQERYMGSVFVNSHGQRKHEEKVAEAYKNYRRAGGTLDLSVGDGDLEKAWPDSKVKGSLGHFLTELATGGQGKVRSHPRYDTKYQRISIVKEHPRINTKGKRGYERLSSLVASMKNREKEWEKLQNKRIGMN